METPRFLDWLHDAGEAVPVMNKVVARSVAWWIAAELIRRHPSNLRVIEMHPAAGTYDCVSIFSVKPGHAAERLVHMNVNPGAHLTPDSWFTGDGSEPRFNWLEVMLCDDRRSYVVEHLERAEELEPPTQTPSTTASSIGPMVISAFLQRSVWGPARWNMVNAMFDSSGYSGTKPRTELIEQFDGLGDWIEQPQPDDIDGIGAYRIWFGCRVPNAWDKVDSDPEPTTAEFAVDTWTGRLWRPKAAPVDLMSRYDKVGRSLDALVSDVCPPAY